MKPKAMLAAVITAALLLAGFGLLDGSKIHGQAAVPSTASEMYVTSSIFSGKVLIDNQGKEQYREGMFRYNAARGTLEEYVVVVRTQGRQVRSIGVWRLVADEPAAQP